jgi:CRP/FNR family cyclic AMP-dependent transcriptional regulator
MKRGKTTFDPKEFLAKVGDGKTISKYRKDQIVFSQGEVADAVFYIQQGKIKLTVISEQGKEAVVAILGPGHFFGEGCLNGHPLRIATTRAMDECVVTRLEKATMIATIHVGSVCCVAETVTVGGWFSARGAGYCLAATR